MTGLRRYRRVLLLVVLPLVATILKHVPPPKKDHHIAGNLAYWAMVLGACAALFSVGALGSVVRGDGSDAGAFRSTRAVYQAQVLRVNASGTGSVQLRICR
jgi:hypothetical protein